MHRNMVEILAQWSDDDLNVLFWHQSLVAGDAMQRQLIRINYINFDETNIEY